MKLLERDRLLPASSDLRECDVGVGRCQVRRVDVAAFEGFVQRHCRHLVRLTRRRPAELEPLLSWYLRCITCCRAFCHSNAVNLSSMDAQHEQLTSLLCRMLLLLLLLQRQHRSSPVTPAALCLALTPQPDECTCKQENPRQPVCRIVADTDSYELTRGAVSPPAAPLEKKRRRGWYRTGQVFAMRISDPVSAC